MTPAQMAYAREALANFDDERMADSLRLALAEIERLHKRACNCAMKETPDAGGHSTTCPIWQEAEPPCKEGCTIGYPHIKECEFDD